MDTDARIPSLLSRPAAALHGHDTVRLAQAMDLLGIVGDHGMGQPTDGSQRAARLAAQVAGAAGADAATCAHAAMVAQLRWSGCRASAAHVRRATPPVDRAMLAAIRCEIGGDIAATMGLPAAVEHGLRHVRDRYDGRGNPQGMRGDAVPGIVYYAALAGDLEILARVHGVAAALARIGELGDARYPARLVALVAPRARDWLGGLDAMDAPAPQPAFLPVSASLTLVADAGELALPWLAGHSRRVAALAQAAAQLAGLPDAQQRTLVRAALLHGIGRAAVPDTVWERKATLCGADRDAVRRAPYWTARAGSRVDGLGPEMQLAAQVYERLDGSGYFCSLDSATLGMPQRLLAAAVAWVALRSPRPWRAAHAPAAARALLASQVTGGRLDRAAVAAVLDAAAGMGAAPGAGDAADDGAAGATLSVREVEVLQRIGLGQGEREAARALRISHGALRTHLESILGKLGCTTWPAAILRALGLGLL